MIKDEKLREELFLKFPTLTDEEYKDITDDYFTHYSIYKRDTIKHHLVCETVKQEVYKCHCTRCGSDYTIDREPGAPPLKHKSGGICPECGKLVIYLAEGRGKQHIWENHQFAVLHELDGNLYVSCYDIYKGFRDNTFMGFSCVETHRYCLTPDVGIQHWKWDYVAYCDSGCIRGWKALKSEIVQYGYIVINKQVVDRTFLRYASDAITYDIKKFYLEYLCYCAAHKGAEYLMKTGFDYLIKSQMISGSMHGLRLNWRSNNVKKILKLNKTEMSLLSNSQIGSLDAYYKFRKADSTTSEAKRAELAKKWDYYVDKIIHIMDITGLSLQRATNYIDKQGKSRTTLSDWKDYLEQCQQLDYDVTDTKISMPKNLNEDHLKLSRLIQVNASKLMQKELDKTNEKRKRFEYTSLDGRYTVRIPKTAYEIIEEGARLDHCVGGYAERHVKGILHILFLRLADKPDVPYYTMEVDLKGRIHQCRGFQNNRSIPKPKEIYQFEKEYQRYLDKLFKKKGRKIA